MSGSLAESQGTFTSAVRFIWCRATEIKLDFAAFLCLFRPSCSLSLMRTSAPLIGQIFSCTVLQLVRINMREN